MKENVKEQPAKTDNQTAQKKQGTAFNPGTQTKNGTKTEKTTTMADEEEDDEQNHNQKEHQDKNHHHDYKMPIGTPIAKDKSQNESQAKTTVKTEMGKGKTLVTNESSKTKQK